VIELESCELHSPKVTKMGSIRAGHKIEYNGAGASGTYPTNINPIHHPVHILEQIKPKFYPGFGILG